MSENDKHFIEMTAKDYGFEVWEVEEIYRKCSLCEFYQELENLLQYKLNC